MSKAASAINGLSVTELVDGIKIYNLTSGKSLPNFLSDRQKRKLRKTDEYRGRVELIQDFDYPFGRVERPKDGSKVALTRLVRTADRIIPIH